VSSLFKSFLFHSILVQESMPCHAMSSQIMSSLVTSHFSSFLFYYCGSLSCQYGLFKSIISSNSNMFAVVYLCIYIHIYIYRIVSCFIKVTCVYCVAWFLGCFLY